MKKPNLVFLTLLLSVAQHVSAAVTTINLKDTVLMPPTTPGKASIYTVPLPGGSGLVFRSANDGMVANRAIHITDPTGAVQVGVAKNSYVQPLNAGDNSASPAIASMASSGLVHATMNLFGYWTPAGNFTSIKDKRYVAFQFRNSATANQWRYGWLELSVKTTTTPLAFPAVTLHRLAYDDSGSQVIMGGGAVQIAPPTIIAPPNQTVAVGTTVVLEAKVTGNGTLTYQWQFNGKSLSNGVGVSGATTPKLTLGNVQSIQSGSYVLTARNAAGPSTSKPAMLNVLAKPVVITPPLNKSVTVGGTVSFEVVAKGGGKLTYQWRYNGANLKSTSTIQGTTTPKLTLSKVQTTQSGNYSVVVSNEVGTFISPVAKLTVTGRAATAAPAPAAKPAPANAVPAAASRAVTSALPVVTSQPINLLITRTNMQDIQSATFTVAVMGQEAASYQWYWNGHPLPGQTQAVLHLPDARRAHNGVFQAVVTTQAGSVAGPENHLRVTSPLQDLSAATHSFGHVELKFRDADGTPFTSADLPNLRLRITDNIHQPLDQWMPISDGLSVRDGLLRYEDKQNLMRSRPYYMVEEIAAPARTR